jgi:hypothetical protein
MNVVIPLSAITDNNFLELRFALRGIAMYVDDPQITLIGACPKWCKGVEHIPATDSPETQWRERNIYRKLLLSPYSEYLCCHDDHFLLQPWAAVTYHNGRIDKLLMTLTRGSIYRKTVLNTTMLYPKAHNFDVHAPIFLKRAWLDKISRVNFSKPFGYCLHTLICEANSIQGVQYDDLKIRKPIVNLQETVAHRAWFSLHDRCLDRSMIEEFKLLFPKKSPWE